MGPVSVSVEDWVSASGGQGGVVTSVYHSALQTGVGLSPGFPIVHTALCTSDSLKDCYKKISRIDYF